MFEKLALTVSKLTHWINLACQKKSKRRVNYSMFIWKANICQNKSLQTVLQQDEWELQELKQLKKFS